MASRNRWIPPIVGFLKINFDEATFKDIDKAGIWAVIRDSHGLAIASISEQTSLSFSLDIVEIVAASHFFCSGTWHNFLYTRGGLRIND